MDADCIYPNLWQGSAPVPGTHLQDAGFGSLILCAQEYQPPGDLFPGVNVIHAPNNDCDTLTKDQLSSAIRAARQAANAVRAGQKVLITCYLGWNRSGLVSALTLYFLTKWPGWRCVQQVKAYREGGLGNPYFVKLVERLPGQVKAPPLGPF